MRLTDKYILFWESCFSNFYPCKIEYENSIFFSSEHLFMYLKAMHFENEDIADLIVVAGTPKEAKTLGRSVKNFDETKWEVHRDFYMNIAVFEKFSQNEDLCAQLLDSKYFKLQFVEASPLDTIWGIGLHYNDILCNDKEYWKGLNLLGETLDKVRSELLNEKRIVSSPRKPRICPICGDNHIVPILYGEPTAEAVAEADAGKIILGGCCLTENNPTWGCTSCQIEIYKK